MPYVNVKITAGAMTDGLNQGWTYTDTISPAAAGQTVLDFYTTQYRHSDQTTWRTRIADGLIQLNNRPTSAETRLKTGQQLSYHRPPWKEPDVPLCFEILYEDEALWAIAKPVGLPVLPGGGFLTHTLLHQMQLRYPDEQPAPVHRLGRGTSGVMLVAKSQQARSMLSRQFRIRTDADSSARQQSSTQILLKRYRALIGPATHAVLPERFTCEHPIGPVDYPQLGKIYAHSPDGKPARSDVVVLSREEKRTVVSVDIQTGRPHQIRIHLAAAGYPLLGDPLYGTDGRPLSSGRAIPSDCGYWLHAHQLRFLHPRTGQSISIEAPLTTMLQTHAERAEQ